ncbi:effector-associated constant component EACC1 [Streptomyces rochei]|uniref:effector-associated constant component EACC1 n=1 Tax=Streptomyces rochei TaxID=1928 RepID=UPI0022E9F70B|nr:hypothetical protein [Streptomyces rochei]MCC8452828.1 hypothetical protein [Streptomyces rochei]
MVLTDRNGGKAPDSLRAFLVRDPLIQAAGRVKWQPVHRAKPGELGTGLDVLTLVITGVLALPSAIETVRKWCASVGPSDASVAVSVGDVTVTVTGSTGPDEIAAMATALTAALESATDTTDDATP